MCVCGVCERAASPQVGVASGGRGHRHLLLLLLQRSVVGKGHLEGVSLTTFRGRTKDDKSANEQLMRGAHSESTQSGGSPGQRHQAPGPHPATPVAPWHSCCPSLHHMTIT